MMLTLMLVLVPLTTSPVNGCVGLAVPDETLLTVRIHDEIAALVGLPVVMVTEADSECATLVKLDPAMRSLQVVARTVEPPVIVTEVLKNATPSSLASHVAEVVRGVLLEVEVRAHPVERPSAPVAVPTVPAPMAPVVVATHDRFDLAVAASGLVSSGGLGPGLEVQVSGGWGFNRWLRLAVSLVLPLVAQQLILPEGQVRVSSFGAWFALQGRLPVGESVELRLGAGVGGWSLAARGVANAPFTGAEGSMTTPAVVVDASGRWTLIGPVGLFLGLSGHLLPARLALDVAGRTAAFSGPVIAAGQLGVDDSW